MPPLPTSVQGAQALEETLEGRQRERTFVSSGERDEEEKNVEGKEEDKNEKKGEEEEGKKGKKKKKDEKGEKREEEPNLAQEWPVARLLNHRFNPITGEVELLAAWQPTWEPQKILKQSCEELEMAYWKADPAEAGWMARREREWKEGKRGAEKGWEEGRKKQAEEKDEDEKEEYGTQGDEGGKGKEDDDSDSKDENYVYEDESDDSDYDLETDE